MKRLLPLVLLLFALAFADDDTKNPWEMHLEGNSFFRTYQLEESLGMPEEFGNMDTTKQNFLMRLAEEELIRIYYGSGFFSAKVTLAIERDTTKDEHPRVFTFFIEEGTRYRFQEISIRVTDLPLEEQVDFSKTDFGEGDLYEQDAFADNLQRISNAYQEKGYLHATVSYMEILDTLNHFVNVDVYVEAGAQVKMGDIQSMAERSTNKRQRERGLSDTAWLNSLWNIPQGEILNGKQSSSFKSKLFSTQLFTQVKMQDSLREDGLSDMHLYVQERVPGEMRYGIFYEQLYGFGASITGRHKNVGGRFHEVGAGATIAQNKQEIALVYAHPLLFGTRIQFIPTAIRFENTLSFNHEKTNPPAYPDSVEERYEIINRGNLTFGLSKNIRFRGTIDTRYVDKNEERLFKFKVETAFTFDFTDDQFNPTKGIRIMPTVGAGTNLDADIRNPTLIGTPYTYGELTTNLYFPILGPLYGALSGSCGKFFNKAIEDDARYFYQGGSSSVRGYRFRSIYASYETEEDGETVINTGLTPMYLRLNQELRFTIPIRGWTHWQLVQFFDWARIMDEESVYESSEEASLGLGIRYRWQFLTFRLDYAFKKTFTDFGPESFAWGRFAFDLSHAF